MREGVLIAMSAALFGAVALYGSAPAYGPSCNPHTVVKYFPIPEPEPVIPKPVMMDWPLTERAVSFNIDTPPHEAAVIEISEPDDEPHHVRHIRRRHHWRRH